MRACNRRPTMTGRGSYNAFSRRSAPLAYSHVRVGRLFVQEDRYRCWPLEIIRGIVSRMWRKAIFAVPPVRDEFGGF